MHWAVRSKKEPMLEAASDPDPVNVNGVTPSEENRSEASLPSSKRCFYMLFTILQLLVFHCNVSVSDDHWYHRFRWAGDAPSGLIHKFRNYEI